MKTFLPKTPSTFGPPSLRPEPQATVHSPKGALSTPHLTEAFNQSVGNPIPFVNTVVRESINLQASDILFEPQKDVIQVRIRVDGVLYKIGEFDQSLYRPITARIKILATLDTTEKFRVQEGQFTFDHEGKVVNLRVEIVQTIYEELIVIRILQLSSIVMELSQLGFSENAFNTYLDILKPQSGLTLVAGPTGCGKTTTIYSTIAHLNKNRVHNVMTIEDPVEYQLPGANQMRVREDVDFTFEEGLRSILRLTPDIIFVGEIRDKETSVIAVESGLTGHMVLSTIHAPDAIGVIYRLLDLGIETYLLNSSLRGVIAQRLVRKICTACTAPYQPDKNEIDAFQKVLGRVPESLKKGKGCPSCQNLGYSGRIGIYEVLEIDSKVRELIRNQTSEDDLREALKKQGFTSLLQDGFSKAEQGIVTIEEVLRNSLRT